MDKYFIPKISDIRIGYECESFDDRLQDTNNIKWVKHLIEDLEDAQYLIEDLSWRVRVPYLTKEQIEAEGWKYLDEHTIDGSSKLRCVFRNGNYWLTVRFNNIIPIVSIIPIDPVKAEFFEQVRYVGYCKCINEFRTILKLLNI